MGIGDAGLSSIEVGLERNHNRVFHLAGGLHRLDLGPLKKFRRVTWVSHFYANGVSASASLSESASFVFTVATLSSNFAISLRLWKFDLVPNQERLQVFLNCLLAMKGDDFPETASLCTKLLCCIEIRRGLFQPLVD